MIKYQQHIDDLVLRSINGVLSNILFSLNNMLPLIISKIRKLFVVYSFTRVIRFSSESHIQNQYTVLAWNININ
jgi:hypothetical protein